MNAPLNRSEEQICVKNISGSASYWPSVLFHPCRFHSCRIYKKYSDKLYLYAYNLSYCQDPWKM